MGLNINSIQSFASLSRPGTNRQLANSFDNRLNVNVPPGAGSASDSAKVSNQTPDKLAQRTVTLQLSTTVGVLNNKEFHVQQQSDTIDSLISKAKEIKREVDPNRRADLVSDATTAISNSQAASTDAASKDSTLTQAQTISLKVDKTASVGSSGGDFTTSISAVGSLSDVGVTTSLSFTSANIDDTISTLESAKSALSTQLSSFSSVRSEISTELSTRGVNGQLQADLKGKDSIEEVAKKLAEQITNSADGLVASGNVEQLDVKTLLDETKKTTTPTEDKTQTDTAATTAAATA